MPEWGAGTSAGEVLAAFSALAHWGPFPLVHHWISSLKQSLKDASSDLVKHNLAHNSTALVALLLSVLKLSMYLDLRILLALRCHLGPKRDPLQQSGYLQWVAQPSAGSAQQLQLPQPAPHARKGNGLLGNNRIWFRNFLQMHTWGTWPSAVAEQNWHD